MITKGKVVSCYSTNNSYLNSTVNCNDLWEKISNAARWQRKSSQIAREHIPITGILRRHLD